MIDHLLKARLKRYRQKSSHITDADISSAKTVLFAVFTRYGDGIISLKVVNEFIEHHPGKQYLVITSNQLEPYARKLLGTAAEIVGLNKRRDMLRLASVVMRLKKHPMDIAFNPWSHGDDSEYFLTFARKFSFYRDFSDHPKEYNLYQRIREYLCVPFPKPHFSATDFQGVKLVVLSPFSTDVTKSLNGEDIEYLLVRVRHRFPGARVVVALQRDERKFLESENELFFYGKNRAASQRFLKLLSEADLFIGVDAGPLHLADALGIPAFGLFGPTSPVTVLDSATHVYPLRHPRLKDVFCFVRECRDPLCLHRLIADDLFEQTTSSTGSVTLETSVCRMDEK